jgi:hypothetical protein
MNDTVEDFVETYTEVVESCERYAFLPRSIEFQRESIKNLTELFEESAQIREDVIREGDEDAANQVLALRCMINALRYELKMWIDLKEENWDVAWNSMVDAQEFAKTARSAHDIAEQCNATNYLHKLEAIEEVIFPPQMFNSPALLVDRFTCSICRENYRECDHIAGQPYWGYFCQRVVDEIAGTREVSIVDNPEDKKARITEFITDDDTIRDRLTWEETELDDDEKEQYAEQSDDGLIIRGIVMTASDTGTDFTEYFPD